MIRIYPRFGQEEELKKRIAELGHGLALRDDQRGRTWLCECTEEQAKQIEGMDSCDLIARLAPETTGREG